MHLTPTLLLTALLPLFAGCQMLADKPTDPNLGTTRMQGELSAGNGHLLFKPCSEARQFVLDDAAGTGILQEAANLADAANAKLFADVRGRLAGSKKAGSDGQIEVTRLYRIERGAHGCEDPNFKQLTLRASGHGPEWDLKASGKGMVIERADQQPLPLPFLEEQLPGGGLSLSSEANGERVELWGGAATLRRRQQRCSAPPQGRAAHRRQDPAGLRLLRWRPRPLTTGRFSAASQGG